MDRGVQRVILAKFIAVGIIFEGAAVHAGVVEQRRDLQFQPIDFTVINIFADGLINGVRRRLRFYRHQFGVVDAVVAVGAELRKLQRPFPTALIILRRYFHRSTRLLIEVLGARNVEQRREQYERE